MISPIPKRILMVRNPAFYDFGGGERFPVSLATELEQYNYDSTIVSRSPQVLKYAKLQRVQIVRGWWWQQQNWSGKRALLFPFYAIWQLALFCWYLQLIFRLRPTVVHLQSKDDFIAGTFAAWLLGKRVVWTDHADLKYIFANHKVWYKNPVGKWVYLASKGAHVITLVSESEKRLIADNLGHELPHSTVIHNGIIDTASTIQPLPSPSGKFVFAATSRLVTAKGIGELIAAFQNLHRQHSNMLLWLIGDGPEAAYFREQAGKDSSIIFVGHSDEALRYVATADVFVHPSYHEGFSLSLIEAAMLGKPIIACNVGGNPEIISNEQNGLLIPEKNVDALQSAMANLLHSSELRERLGKAARASFVDNFDFSHIVKERFLPIYERE